MSLWDIFRGRFKGPETEPEAEDQASAGQERLRLPDLHRGTPIEVMTEDGTVLFTGRPTAFDATQLLLERLPGALSLPILEEGLSIRLRGFSRAMEPLNFCGRVEQSGTVSCKVNQLQYIPYQNSRGSQRQPVKVNAQLYAVEDTRLDRPQPCQLVNISTGGACVTCACRYPEGKAVRLRMEMVRGEGYMSFVGQVVRAQEREEGGYEYGILFAQLRRSQINSLLKDIAEYQKETEKLLLD